MLFRIAKPVVPVEIVKTMTHRHETNATESEAERRRQMYERIAQGNALAEVEDNARRLWNG